MRMIFNFRALPLAATAVAVLTGALPANAAVNTYNTRAAFEAAAGTTAIQDFNSFVVDTPYRSAPVDVAGQFTLGGTVLNGFPDENYIDVLPFVTNQTNVDGTPHVRAWSRIGSTVVITFAQAITAFGADFADLNNFDVEVPFKTGITIAGSTLFPTVRNVVRFWGAIFDTDFTTVTFNGFANDRFGIDNVTFSAPAAGAVPEPAIWAMMIGGFGLVGTTARRRRSIRVAC